VKLAFWIGALIALIRFIVLWLKRQRVPKSETVDRRDHVPLRERDQNALRRHLPVEPLPEPVPVNDPVPVRVDPPRPVPVRDEQLVNDAISALNNLGWPKRVAKETVNNVYSPGMTDLNKLIKLALKG
jgi:hypothetical protein